MRDYFGLLEHIRKALLAVPLATIAGAGCGRTDNTQTFVPAELEMNCVFQDSAVKNEIFPMYPRYEGCPNTVLVREKADWVPKDVPVGSSGVIDEEKTDSLVDLQPRRCCYEWNVPVDGRPLVERGEVITAGVRERRWHAPRRELEVREDLARKWLDAALAEHASIASFARATLELMAVGAPRELIRETQIAGLDELRHADLCFELASTYAGRELSPGPLDVPAVRAPELARLAVDTFREGCTGETIAALRATREVERAAGREREVLEVIVRDETKHAALAWKTLAWAIAEGGEPVRNALREVAPEPPEPPEPPDRNRDRDRDGRDVARDAWRHIIAPTLASLIA